MKKISLLNYQFQIIYISILLSLLTLCAGETPDMTNYVRYYSNSCDGNLNDYLLVTGKEPLFSLIIYFMGQISICEFPNIYRFSLAFIGLSIVGVGSFNLIRVFLNERQSLILTFSILVFPILLEGSSHLVRQIWALGFCLFLLRYGQVIYFILGVGVHLTALLFFPLFLIGKKNIAILTGAILIGALAYTIIDSQNVLSQLTYLRLIGLSESIGDVILSELSIFAYVILFLTPCFVWRLFSRSLREKKPEQLLVSIKILVYTVATFFVIFTSIILGYSEMSVRFMYYIYPIFLITLGIFIATSWKSIFNIYGYAQAAALFSLYILRNFL